MTSFEEYLQEINTNLAHGDATEHTHRPALKKLLETLGPGITATNEPTRILCGAPDFNLTKGKVPLGHVETKTVGENLTQMERGKPPHGDQFIRYRDGLLNWVLTDYLEFRWYVDGEHRWTARLGELDADGKAKAIPGGEKEVAGLLDAFLAQKSKTIGTAQDLARRMAGMTRIIRDLIKESFQQEVENGWLHNWLVAFRKVLVPDLKPFLTDTERRKPKRPPAFDDMFAQTLAYGLFAARVHTPPGKEFSRELAAFNLPKTNPFLRKLFSEIAGVDMPETIDWAVDDLVSLLNQADMAAVLRDFGTGKGRTDPVIHFYETFLKAYDPQLREVRGVYYTPEPVVGYIVRSIDYLLKARFGREEGLADANTLILDPATGTATFLYFVIERIFKERGKQSGAWDGYVDKNLLHRIFGFELLIAPYAIAHLKLGMQLQQTGYQFGSGQRLGIYLTNTLEEAAGTSEQLIAGWIAEEANAAATIKSDKPIMVVLGNPPYSGHSANRSWAEIQVTKGQEYVADFGLEQGRVTEVKRNAAADGIVEVPTFIGRLIQDYYVVDGAWLDERNTKWVQNDYVKFIRFAQWRIDKTGEGMMGYITSNSYLFSPTLRGMRQNLMRSFTEIYIYDLHGNSNKPEYSLDGSRDKNVFDIVEGVSIILCVKETGKRKRARVFHADLLGGREAKFKTLAETDVSKTRWTELKPASPNYLFVPQSAKRHTEYDKAWLVTDIFPLNGWGIATRKDYLLVDFDRKPLVAKFMDILSLSADEAIAKYGIRESPHWDFRSAKSELNPNVSQAVKPVLFRPFDTRNVFYDRAMIERGDHRYPLMRHMLKPNISLITVRRVETFAGFDHVFCTRSLSVLHTVSMKEGNFVFPLYLYEEERAEQQKRRGGTMLMALFETSPGYITRRANMNPKFIDDLTQRLGLKWTPVDTGDLKKTIGPEDVFHYAYAVFHSPSYRKRYAEFLKIDFPRLPLTGDLKLFRSLAAKGEELAALHLMESPRLDKLITEFPVKGTDEMEKVRYTDHDRRVWFNARQYFGGVPKAVWEFRVGGYQVCEKWLKDRKGRKLSYDDIQHYQRIVVALCETTRLMTEIDAAIEHHGSWPLK
jgi:predicted helicase